MMKGPIWKGVHMNESSAKYQVTINGSVYDLAIGDEASISAGVGRAPRPFLAPPPPSQGVLGRDELLTRVYDLLQIGDSAATDVTPAALQGMGGIGKTTVAATLGRLTTIRQVFPDGVLWATLGPRPNVRAFLEMWGRALGIDLLPEHDERACRDRLLGVLFQRKVLILIDDVWDVRAAQYFLVGGPQCRTLFTTREAPIAHTLATSQRTVRVDVLQPEHAFLLLSRLAPEAAASNVAIAQRVCEKLEYLPLALTLAGRMLASEADVPRRMQRLLGELIERRDARLQLVQSEGRAGVSEEHPISLGAILGMSIDRLSPGDQQRFAMLAVFGGEPLTWEIEGSAAVWECSMEEAETTIAHLIQRGLVEREHQHYKMHALLADYAEKMLEEMCL
jgi:hypothetical protein